MTEIGLTDGRAAGMPPPGKTTRRGLLTVVGWWAAAAVAFVAFVASRPGAAPGCDGWDCLGDQGGWFIYGVVVGLPVLVIGLLIDCVAVAVILRVARGRVRSGAVLGTVVVWSTFVAAAVVLAMMPGGLPS